MATYLRRLLSLLLVFIIGLAGVQLLFAPLPSIHPNDLFVSSLRFFLDREETRYQVALHDREGLVQKWGPTAQDIISFPKQGQTYTIWDFFAPSFQCPHLVQRVGVLGDGGKWFCGLDRYTQQRAPCAVYSFGINGESSFEAELLKSAPQCELWGYDFSVDSFGPEIENDPTLKARSHFFPYALGAADQPHNNPPTYTLQTLMQQNGHSFVDVLKVDVEGAEFDSLASFVNHFIPADASPDAVLPIGQLQLEIHLWGQGMPFHAFKQWWENLERAGLRPFYSEPNLVYLLIVSGALPDLSEYSFINIRGKHALTDNHY